MKLLFFCFISTLFISCKKEKPSNSVSIKGQLLESSSNPTIISNYTLSFYQREISVLLGGIHGLEQNVITDNNGNFNCVYDPKRNYGLNEGGTNSNRVSIYGLGYVNQSNPIQPVWIGIDGAENINVGQLYLYKKIGVLVRKVIFSKPLTAGESLELISSNRYGANYKTLNGPIPTGSSYIDTITNCKLNFYDIQNQVYRLSLTLKKPQYQKDTSYILNSLDEISRTTEIIY